MAVCSMSAPGLVCFSEIQPFKLGVSPMMVLILVHQMAIDASYVNKLRYIIKL